MANKNISKRFLAALLAAFALSSCGETAAIEESTESEETIIASDSEESSETSSEEEPEESTPDSIEPADEREVLKPDFTGGALAGGEDEDSVIDYVIRSGNLFLSEPIVVEGYARLDLNGHMVYLKEGCGSYVINVKSGCLTIYDNSEDEVGFEFYEDENGRYCVNNVTEEWNEAYASAEITGKIDGGVISSYDAVGVFVDIGATFVLEEGAVAGNAPTNGNYGGGISVDGTLIMNGGSVIGNSAYRGGGIYIWGSGTINGGTIAENYASQSAGGVYVYGDLDLEDGEIIDNYAVSYGGALYVAGTAEMRGGTINGNQAGTYNGVYMPTYNGSFDMYEGRLGDASYSSYNLISIYQGYMSEAAYSVSSRYIDSSSSVLETGDEDWPYRIEMA